MKKFSWRNCESTQCVGLLEIAQLSCTEYCTALASKRRMHMAFPKWQESTVLDGKFSLWIVVTVINSKT